MTAYDDFDKQGSESYNKGHFREAAFAYEQARRFAKDFGMKREEFKSGFWAAHSWEQAGEVMRALQGYLELSQNIPAEADILDKWRVKKYSYEIRFFHFPQLATLERQLSELQQMLQEYTTLPPADGCHLKANLLAAQGRWAEQLKYLEQGWQAHNGGGYYKYLLAKGAIDANLALHQHQDAQRWCEVLAQTDTDSPTSRFAHIAAQIKLALYQQQPTHAYQQLRELERLNDDLQHDGAARTTVALQIRCYLLQTELGDPKQRSHSARRRFAVRIKGQRSVFSIYSRHLLRLDYRLACVRWALSVSAVDDLYYTKNQDLTSFKLRCSMDDIQQRIAKAKQAINLALKYAQYLDDCFEYNWRQQQVNEHNQRLQNLIHLLENTKEKPL